jgi:hypothetical protein
MPATPDDSEKDNVVIYTNGKIYSIPVDVYTDEKYRIKDTEHARGIPVWSALESGVVVAKLHGLGVGVGGFCTLLNLPALTPPEVHPPAALAKHFKNETLESINLVKTLAPKSNLGLESIDGLESHKRSLPKPKPKTAPKPAPKTATKPKK